MALPRSHMALVNAHSRNQLQPILNDMLQAYLQIQSILKEGQDWDTSRLEQSAKRTHGMIQEGLETGCRIKSTTGLLNLISDCHALRTSEETFLMQKLQPYLESLGKLIRDVSEMVGTDCTLPHPDDYNGPAAKRQRHILLEGLEKEHKEDDTRKGILKMLRDPQSKWGNNLSASEHKLLCTVVTESALLPDISAMHDFYHPNICLYDNSGDLKWDDPMGIHLGFFVTTMLHEVVLHRGSMRRFSFVHLMYRMGFAAADINHFVTYVDDTFYRRVYCDTRIGFLAESFSPRIRVYRGREWARLWDCYLANQHRDDGVQWYKLTRAGVMAEEIIKESFNYDPQQLLPNTVIGALHRRFGTRMAPYDSWAAMETLTTMESSFLSGVQNLRRGTLSAMLDGLQTHVRAWPICLRQVAVHHVRSLVQTLSLIPRTPQIIELATDAEEVDPHTARDWLWSLIPRTEELLPDDDPDEPWSSSANMLLYKLQEHMVAPSTGQSLMDICEELCEDALQQAAVARHGVVTDAQRNKMQQHLENLNVLVHAASLHSPNLWPERKRRVYGYRPLEVFAAVRQETEFLTPAEHETALAERLRSVMDDPVAKDLGLESVTGDSQLRPQTLYPQST